MRGPEAMGWQRPTALFVLSKKGGNRHTVENGIARLETEVKQQVAAELQGLLVDPLAIALNGKQAHWHVHGSHFVPGRSWRCRRRSSSCPVGRSGGGRYVVA